MSGRSSWFIILFKTFISLLILCLIVLSIIESEAVKSSTLIVEVFILLILSIFAFIYLEALLLGVCVYIYPSDSGKPYASLRW